MAPEPEDYQKPQWLMTPSEQLCLREPRAFGTWNERMEKFMDGIRRIGEKDRRLNEAEVRCLWAGAFSNNSLWECEQADLLLRREVEIGVQTGGREFMRAAMRADWDFCSPDSIDLEGYLTNKEKSPLLMFEKGKTVVVTNMVGGMPYTPLVIESLNTLNREPVDFAIMGWSKHGSTYYADGGQMKKQLCVPPADLDVLLRNLDKAALVVDDTHIWGSSYRNIRRALRDIGFEREKIYKFTGREGILRDGNAKEIGI